jgi:putative oxidoreductase
MSFPPYVQAYERWAPRVARALLAIQFSVAAYYKLTMFSMQVGQTVAVGVPLPQVAVALGLVLELVGIAALVTGWQLRRISVVLAAYVALLAVLFYRDWSDPMKFGFFISHLGLIAACLYVSVYGAKR